MTKIRRRPWSATIPGDGTAIIPLTRGYSAIIDVADLGLVSDQTWHAMRRSDGKEVYASNSEQQKMHRVLMGLPGFKVDPRIVDHRDGNGLNNRRSNLRIGTQSLNSVNRLRSSGQYLPGVDCRGAKWRARVRVGGKIKSLGNYGTEGEAHEAYLAERQRLFGEWTPDPTVRECTVEVWSMAE